MLDQIIKWAAFGASLATIAAIYFLIQQIRLERSARDEERAERKRQRERQRNSIFSSLKAEIAAIRKTVDEDLNRYPGSSGIPRAKEAQAQKQGEDLIGNMAYYRSFIWTTLPTSIIEQALREADLLILTAEHLEELQNLRQRILRADSLVPAKTAILPLLLESGYQGGGAEQTPSRWVDIKADNLNGNIETAFKAILNECNEIAKWLSALPMG